MLRCASSCCDEQIFCRFIALDFFANKQLPSWHDGSHRHYKKKGKRGRLISSGWWRSAAASTFTGGYADSSNRRRCLCFFLNFSLFNKTIESLCALSSFTLPQIS
ncbi:hypothetical protein QL285_003667 [Trifolium repens]|nr:hypothetical protein QL285_003667 [Trifolium repens]